MHKSIFTPVFKSVGLLLIVAALCSFSKTSSGIHHPKQNLADTALGDRFKDLYIYMAKTVRYPKIARENQAMGRVIAFVEINDAGEISSAKIWRGIGNGCDEEVVMDLRAFKNKLPMAKPGVYLLPVSFMFKGEKLPPLSPEIKSTPNLLDEIAITAL